MKKTLLTEKELLSAVNGNKFGNAECIFDGVETDSRNVKNSSHCMFVPLVGEFQNGHKYIPAAIEDGASVILMNNKEFEEQTEIYINLSKKYPDVLFVRVENTLHALQAAAEAYVSKKCKDMIKVSITGSSGKTTTKEMMVAVAKAYYGEKFVAYTKGNLNSETGLPLSVFHIKGTEKIGIFEMGMNRVDEIGEISAVLKSQYGIITNIGTAHIGILGSRENIAKEKRKSFNYIPEDGAVFVCADDEYADYCTENVKGKIIKYGCSVDPLVSGIRYISDNGIEGSSFCVDNVRINLPLPGYYNYQNACGVIACARQLGIPASFIKQGLENMGSLNGRLSAKKVELKNNKNITLIADCYNANPDSMDGAIEFCRKLKNKIIYVLGDMKELGDFSALEHKVIGSKLLSTDPRCIILVGPEMKVAADLIENGQYKDRFYYYENNDETVICSISEKILELINDDDVLLLKASHSIALERIIPLISKGDKEADKN